MYARTALSTSSIASASAKIVTKRETTVNAMNTTMNKKLLELSETLRGIAEGKEWECRHWSNEDWLSDEYPCPITAMEEGYQIRLKPWKLPDPPEGRECPKCGEKHN
jgi:hypothetical protein